MWIKKVQLKNYRNYQEQALELEQGKTILIGENAQGKSNFLESIEVASLGKSSRASSDQDLIGWSKPQMSLEVSFEKRGFEEVIGISLTKKDPDTSAQAAAPATRSSRAIEKKIQINGVSQSSVKALLGRLICVSFTTQDLNLIRGGPSFRREWIDDIICRIKPIFYQELNSYQKVVTQRNRLLKMFFEKGRITVSDQDQLAAWDQQLARFGAKIIKERLRLLQNILPLAESFQRHLSGQKEILQTDYIFQAGQQGSSEDDESGLPAISVEKLAQSDEKEVASIIIGLLKQQRSAEIGRKQTLCGPHRDDILFTLNKAYASAFASQGQQRSLVLAMKLAELKLLTESLEEPPVLLLDDVLAELDLGRQGLLMSAVNQDLQTIITTTHLSKFEPEWLSGAKIFQVKQGRIESIMAGAV